MWPLLGVHVVLRAESLKFVYLEGRHCDRGRKERTTNPGTVKRSPLHPKLCSRATQGRHFPSDSAKSPQEGNFFRSKVACVSGTCPVTAWPSRARRDPCLGLHLVWHSFTALGLAFFLSCRQRWARRSLTLRPASLSETPFARRVCSLRTVQRPQLCRHLRQLLLLREPAFSPVDSRTRCGRRSLCKIH